jgi:hypothetical protein
VNGVFSTGLIEYKNLILGTRTIRSNLQRPDRLPGESLIFPFSKWELEGIFLQQMLDFIQAAWNFFKP